MHCPSTMQQGTLYYAYIVLFIYVLTNHGALCVVLYKNILIVKIKQSILHAILTKGLWGETYYNGNIYLQCTVYAQEKKK